MPADMTSTKQVHDSTVGAKKAAKKTTSKLSGSMKTTITGSQKKTQSAKKSTKPDQPSLGGYVPLVKIVYRDTVRAQLVEKFGYRSIMQAPRLEKIVISIGVGDAIQNRKLLDATVEELTLICGQRAVKTKARKSISNFKLRAGMEIGAKVTLRADTMYDFFGRLIHIALPRVKDFRGLNPNSFDGHGNYSLGINEQIIFPEINYDKIERISGLNVVIATTARTDEEALQLLTKLGAPFRK